MLEAGIKAPDFTLNDKDGNQISLSDYLGKRWYYIFTQGIIHRDAPKRHVHLRELMKDFAGMMWW